VAGSFLLISILNIVAGDELRALTSASPDISHWAFVDENDTLLDGGHQRISPSQWVAKGADGILEALDSIAP